MANKRLGKRRRRQVRARPIQHAIDNQAQIDGRDRANQKQDCVGNKNKLPKK